MLLDYIDTLSSNRLEKYKILLSDVKCRTVNKQYAQWLLSIRSFSLINLCWSIVKFYKKTTCKESETKIIQDTQLGELNERISSLSMHRTGEFKCRSTSTSSSTSSNSTISESSNRARSTKNNFIKRPEIDFFQVSESEKYDFYLKAALK
jgi:hypothetical protein